MAWTLGTVKLSRRVAIDIKIECGGELQPAELLAISRLLEWIAVAVRRWQRDSAEIGAGPKASNSTTAT